MKLALWVNGEDLVCAESEDAANTLVMESRKVDALTARAEGWHEIEGPTVIPIPKLGQMKEQTATEWLAELPRGYVRSIW